MLAALAAAVPAAFADLATQQASLDQRIDSLKSRIEEAKRRERVLTSDIDAASERISVVQGRVDELGAEVDALERTLAVHQARLDALRDLYADQTRVLGIAEQQEAEAEARLERRIVELYQTGQPDTLEIALSVSSLGDLISQLDYAAAIARRDREIAEAVERARRDVQAARARTAGLRDAEARTTAVLDRETQARRAALDELVSRRDELVAAREDRRALLGSIRGHRHEAEEDVAALQEESARLAERIREAQSSSGSSVPVPSAASSGGFVWPVSGPITSPFGWRWGRMHEGIDIGVGFGTPIHAAAAGTVIYAGWMGGYGNLVVIDHGGGLSTAYGHQQRIDVSSGQRVAQGQAIGEVGSTGHSFGPHLHFEVRVNGSPVDPLGYL